jgi:hypothetical protein
MGGADHVSGVPEADGEPASDRAPLAERKRTKHPQRRLDLLGLVEKRRLGGRGRRGERCGIVAGREPERHGLRPGAAMVFLEPDLLQTCRSPKHPRKQVRRAIRAEDRSAEPQARKHREAAAVVDVGVRDDDGGERREVEKRRVDVPPLALARSLEESEVDQHPACGRLEQRAGTGDFARGAEAGQGE